jgi:hypothetical protein
VNQFWRHQLFWPVVLIVVGVYFLLLNLGLLWWLRPEIAWPIILIAIGVWLILRRSRT